MHTCTPLLINMSIVKLVSSPLVLMSTPHVLWVLLVHTHESFLSTQVTKIVKFHDRNLLFFYYFRWSKTCATHVRRLMADSELQKSNLLLLVWQQCLLCLIFKPAHWVLFCYPAFCLNACLCQRIHKFLSAWVEHMTGL